jgi:hypothetical protein
MVKLTRHIAWHARISTLKDGIAHHLSPSGLVKAWRPASRHTLAHHGRGKRELISQVLDPAYEIFNGCPRIAIMCGKDRFDRIELRLIDYYGCFNTHWTHVSIPLGHGGYDHQVIGKLRPGRSSRLFLLCSDQRESQVAEVYRSGWLRMFDNVRKMRRNGKGCLSTRPEPPSWF